MLVDGWISERQYPITGAAIYCAQLVSPDLRLGNVGASCASSELTYRVATGQNGENKVWKLTLLGHHLSSIWELEVAGAATTMAGSSVERAAITLVYTGQ